MVLKNQDLVQAWKIQVQISAQPLSLPEVLGPVTIERPTSQGCCAGKRKGGIMCTTQNSLEKGQDRNVKNTVRKEVKNGWMKVFYLEAFERASGMLAPL